jgi:hypothetical protein
MDIAQWTLNPDKAFAPIGVANNPINRAVAAANIAMVLRKNHASI